MKAAPFPFPALMSPLCCIFCVIPPFMYEYKSPPPVQNGKRKFKTAQDNSYTVERKVGKKSGKVEEGRGRRRGGDDDDTSLDTSLDASLYACLVRLDLTDRRKELL